VLTRAGHTEAGCDLAALGGLEPAAVLIEILHEDGSMARRPELEVFAKKHGLKIGSIADLIRYRLETEKTVQRVYEEDVQTEFGPFRLVAYRDAIRHGLHFALLRGKVDDGAPVLTRVHVRNTLSDVLHLQREDLGLTVTSALRRIADEGRGALLVLSGEDTPEALLRRLNRQPDVKAPEEAQQQEWRQLGLGAQILADLGIRQLRVLGTPRKMVGLGGFGLEVVEYV
jgi:3,4-dihydroxy 2-butanone 4-phosphate synthase/GTP cyclohydrolase II